MRNSINNLNQTVMKTIEEKNKMIAEFMGAYIAKIAQQALDMDECFPNGKDRLMPEKMEYHSSWDWLMPVVEKIESLGLNYTIIIMPNYVTIDTLPKIISKNGDRLGNVYDAVIRFIQYHNENK